MLKHLETVLVSERLAAVVSKYLTKDDVTSDHQNGVTGLIWLSLDSQIETALGLWNEGYVKILFSFIVSFR